MIKIIIFKFKQFILIKTTKMVFRIKRTLTDRQLIKCKFSVFMAIICLIFTFGTSHVQSEIKKFNEDDATNLKNGDPDLDFDGEHYHVWEKIEYERGHITYFSSNEVICNSPLLIPGVAILPRTLLAVFYFVTLIYLFLAIGLVSDIFME